MQSKNYALRIPEDLYEKVKEIAINEERSLNAQIIVILREGVERRELESPKSDRREMISQAAA